MSLFTKAEREGNVSVPIEELRRRSGWQRGHRGEDAGEAHSKSVRAMGLTGSSKAWHDEKLTEKGLPPTADEVGNIALLDELATMLNEGRVGDARALLKKAMAHKTVSFGKSVVDPNCHEPKCALHGKK